MGSHVDVVGLLFSGLLGLSGPAVEHVLHDLVPSLYFVGGATWHEIQQFGMHIEPQLPVFAGLSIHFLGLLAPRLPVLEVAEGIADPEIVLIVDLTYVDLLEFVEELEVIVDLRVGAVTDVLVGLEEDFEVAALLLALGARPRPLLHDLLGLAHRGLHQQRGVVR